MASQSSKESVASRQGKVTTIIPERSRAAPRRRLAKRQTTLRAFTFVRDWEARQSPLARVHEQKDDDAASSSRSSVTISPAPQVIRQASSLSSSGRPRVSPGPIIIASSCPSSQKKTPSHTSSNLHRSSRRGVVLEGGLATSILGQTPSDSSAVHASSVTSLQRSIIPPATSTPASDDPSISHEGSSKEIPSEEVEGHNDGVGHDERATPSVTSSPVVNDSPTLATSQTANSSQSQMGDASPDVTMKRLGQRSTDTPLMQWRNDQSRFLTPGEKSMSIITKTPKSGPVSRQGAPRRRKLSSPPEGAKQQSVIAPGAKKAKIRLWSGNGRRRLATDVTDLDIVLNTLEQVTADYKKKLESSSQRRALTKFFYIMKKELVDKIDLSQEYKVLKCALTRMTATTRKQRKRLLSLQQENARLNSRIGELKNNASNKKDKVAELNEISTFLSDLQQLHQDFDNTIRGDEAGDAKPEFSSPNIGPLLTDVKGSSRSAYSLRSVNNQLEKWLEAH